MTEHKGKIITFYSFKGGVGRSMALANVAALLSRWGMRVLVIDWDLEAPGIEGFFESVAKDIRSERKRQSGVVEMIGSFQSTNSLQWREAIMHVPIMPNSEPIHIMTAGRSDGSYIARLQAIGWGDLFSKKKLGNRLDEMRREWLDEYDFVLIDSRTGISDIGGITTILFPDILVLFFTTTNQSVNGVNDVMRRALKSQGELPFDRTRMLGIPVPARDESHSERKLTERWYKTFAKELGWIYKEWLPSNIEPREAIVKIRIPYVPRWSFFEGMPVIEEGTDAPEGIGAAYERLAKLLFFLTAIGRGSNGDLTRWQQPKS
jgi:cellulose biosynthesis protein BcsQ